MERKRFGVKHTRTKKIYGTVNQGFHDWKSNFYAPLYFDLIWSNLDLKGPRLDKEEIEWMMSPQQDKRT